MSAQSNSRNLVGNGQIVSAITTLSHTLTFMGWRKNHMDLAQAGRAQHLHLNANEVCKLPRTSSRPRTAVCFSFPPEQKQPHSGVTTKGFLPQATSQPAPSLVDSIPPEHSNARYSHFYHHISPMITKGLLLGVYSARVHFCTLKG